jgi:type I restriction enzyme S subunit
MSDLVPAGWKALEVQSAFEIGRGRVISKPEIRDNLGPYPVYSSQSKNNGKMGSIATYDFEGEYITWTTDGAYAGTVFHREGRFNCTNVCGTLKDKGHYEVYPRFVASYLGTVAKNHVSYVGNPKLMNGTFAEIEFLLPPLPEQQKIAAILSSVDEVIEKTQAQINKLKDLKTGMMQELLSPREGQAANINNPQGESKNGLHHTEFKDSPLGRIPVGWEVVPLGDKASLVPGYAFSSTDFTKNGTPLIRMGNLYQNRLDLKRAPKFMHKDLIEKHPRFVVSPNDIVFSMTGTSGKEDYGFAVQIPNTAPICLLNQRVAKVVPSKEITKSFLLHLLHSRLFLDEVYSAGAGTKQANLSSANILDIKLPFPPIEEQEKIANALNSVSERISVINKRLNALSFSKKALMQDLLTGKVRVKVD